MTIYVQSDGIPCVKLSFISQKIKGLTYITITGVKAFINVIVIIKYTATCTFVCYCLLIHSCPSIH